MQPYPVQDERLTLGKKSGGIERRNRRGSILVNAVIWPPVNSKFSDIKPWHDIQYLFRITSSNVIAFVHVAFMGSKTQTCP